MTQALRLDFHGSTALFNDLTYDGQAQADPLVVQLCRSMQLAKASEELLNVIWGDTRARVTHLHLEALILLYVFLLDLYDTLLGEFNRIFDEVNEHLFVASLVTYQKNGLHRARLR